MDTVVFSTTSPLVEQVNQQKAELLQREQFLNLLTQITNEAASILDFHQMMQAVADNLPRLSQCDGCLIAAWNPINKVVTPLAASSTFQETYTSLPPLPDKDTFIAAILHGEKVIAVADTQQSPFQKDHIVTRFKAASLLGIPLMAGTQKMGGAILVFQTPHAFSPEEIWRAEQAAPPISLAMAKAHLLHQEQEQRALAEALRDAGTVIGETLDFDEVLDRILEQIGRVVPYDSANIMLLEHGYADMVRHRGYEQTDPALAAELIQMSLYIETTATLRQIVHTKQPYIVPDTTTFPGWVGIVGHIRSWAGVPIIIGGRVVAVVGVDKTEPHFYRPEHMARLSAFANQVALALQNAQLHKATQRQIEELSVLQALASAGVEVENEDDLLERATQIIGDTLYPHNFGVLLLDDTAQTLHVHPSYRIKDKNFRPDGFLLGEGITGHVAFTGQPYRSGDVHTDPHYINSDPETHSELCVPLFAGDRLMGVINAESKKTNAFSDSDEYLLTTFARQLGVVIEKMRLIAETRRRAEEMRLVSRILRKLNATPDVTAVFPELSADIKKLTGCTAVTLLLLNNQPTLSHNLAPDIPQLHGPITHLLADTAVAQHIIASKIYEVPYLPAAADQPLEKLLRAAGYQSCMTVPLHTGANPIGGLNLAWPQPEGYRFTSVTYFQQVASAIALALQRSQLFEEIKQWAYQLTILQNLNREITGLVEMKQICTAFAQHISRHLKYQSVSIHRIDHDAQEVICEALTGPQQEHIDIGTYKQKLGEGLVGLTAQTGKPLIVNDTASHPHFLPSPYLQVRSELVLPLQHGPQPVGVLNVNSADKNAFSNKDVAILTLAADQLAAALERARLFEQTRQHADNLEQRNRELVALNEVGKILVATLDRHVIYRAIYHQTIQPLMSVPHLIIALYNPLTKIIHCDYAIVDGIETEPSEFPPLPLGQGIVSEIIRTRQGRIVDLNTAVNTRFVQIGDEREARSGLYAPLISGDNVLGVMYVQDYIPDAFTGSDLTLLSTLATQVSVAIEKSRLFAQTELRAAKLEALSALSTELRTAQAIDEMLPPILARAMSVVSGSLGSLYLKEPETGDMVARGVHPPNPALLGRRFKVGEGITGYIADTGKIHITENMAASKQARFYTQEKQLVEEMHIRCGIGLPLRAQERIVGVLYISLPHEHVFTTEEIEFLVAICEIAGSALDRMLVLQTLEDRVAERTRALAEANEQLKQLDRLKSKFISDVSHELRTPVTNLNLYLDLFDHNKPEKQAHYLAVLRKQTARLTQLIEDILSLSRLELGKGKIKHAPLDLNELVATAVTVFWPRITEADLTLTPALHPNLPQIEGESNQLSLLISHLLANAIQYTRGGRIDVSTGINEPADKVFFQVTDTGHGISQADQTHLFDRFYRGRNASQLNVPGTGLGLAIVKEVVDLHGGDIKMESTEGVGTTFTVWLPVPHHS